MTIRSLVVSIALSLALSACITGPIPLSPQIRSEMPASGRLPPGEVVYVDDSGCPAGQIKRVTGGGNRVYGTDANQVGVPRQVECVPRP